MSVDDDFLMCTAKETAIIGGVASASLVASLPWSRLKVILTCDRPTPPFKNLSDVVVRSTKEKGIGVWFTGASSSLFQYTPRRVLWLMSYRWYEHYLTSSSSSSSSGSTTQWWSSQCGSDFSAGALAQMSTSAVFFPADVEGRRRLNRKYRGTGSGGGGGGEFQSASGSSPSRLRNLVHEYYQGFCMHLCEAMLSRGVCLGLYGYLRPPTSTKTDKEVQGPWNLFSRRVLAAIGAHTVGAVVSRPFKVLAVRQCVCSVSYHGKSLLLVVRQITCNEGITVWFRGAGKYAAAGCLRDAFVLASVDTIIGLRKGG